MRVPALNAVRGERSVRVCRSIALATVLVMTEKRPTTEAELLIIRVQAVAGTSRCAYQAAPPTAIVKKTVTAKVTQKKRSLPS